MAARAIRRARRGASPSSPAGTGPRSASRSIPSRIDQRTSDAPASPVQNAALTSVTEELNTAVKQLQDLQEAGKGSTDEARRLLERIRTLQEQRNQLVAEGQ